MANYNLKDRPPMLETESPRPARLETGVAECTRPGCVFAAGLRAFAENYDLFLVDQWGVLHNGQTAYPGVAECLRQLLSLGKRIVILSNSGKRAKANSLQLASMGITEDCYTLLITSGEIARESLSSRTHPFLPALGHRCLLLSSDGDSSPADGLDIELAPTVVAADFILLAGVSDSRPMEFYQQILDDASARRLPLVCSNPDLVRLSRKGLVFSAGEVARRYERMGGVVHYIGKPYPMIYEHCRKILPDFESSRVIAIGDSFFHDVVGGARFGLATAFVTDGVHKVDFADTTDEADILRKLTEFAQSYEVWPDWIIRRFQW
jgi:HAD superfamily hydrolase (TIGR01459 family)